MKSQAKYTVIVLSYNSSATIIETLESVKNQNYDCAGVELLISDDASVDKTEDIVCGWLESNRKFFFDACYISSSANQGVSKNFNKAAKRASSTWVKAIAADDVLMPNCLRDFDRFIINNPGVSICYSRMETFGDVEGEYYPRKKYSYFPRLSCRRQLFFLLFFNPVPSPAVIMRKSLLEEVGFCDERARNIEDIFLWLKVAYAGYKIYFADYVTVRYRVGSGVSSSGMNLAVNFRYEEKRYQYAYIIREYTSSSLLKGMVFYDNLNRYFTSKLYGYLFAKGYKLFARFLYRAGSGMRFEKIISTGAGIFYKYLRL